MLHLKLVEIAELKTPNLNFQTESGFVRVVALFTTEMKTHHRIYFGRALSNWGVVVSHQGIRRGAATLSTQESHPFMGESMSNDRYL